MDFSETAAEKFGDLRRLKIRIGTMDLKIAASCLCEDALLLTRNTVDYSKVPGLRFEDWTQSLSGNSASVFSGLRRSGSVVKFLRFTWIRPS